MFKNWLLVVVIIEENVLKKSDDFLDIEYLILNHPGGDEFGGRKKIHVLVPFTPKEAKSGD